MTEYSDYLDKMRTRYPWLSMRKMSEGAGLNSDDVSKLRRGEKKPDPEVLYALAHKWGRTPEEKENDYRELMRLAGHPVAESRLAGKERRALEALEMFSELTQERLINLLSDAAGRPDLMIHTLANTEAEMKDHGGGGGELASIYYYASQMSKEYQKQLLEVARVFLRASKGDTSDDEEGE